MAMAMAMAMASNHSMSGLRLRSFRRIGIPSGGTGCDLVSSGGAGSRLPLPRDASQSVARGAVCFSKCCVEGLLGAKPPVGRAAPVGDALTAFVASEARHDVASDRQHLGTRWQRGRGFRREWKVEAWAA